MFCQGEEDCMYARGARKYNRIKGYTKMIYACDVMGLSLPQI